MQIRLKGTYRQIAKHLTKALPVEGQGFREKVEENLKAIERLPKVQRQALKIAYIFASKVPKEEREDMFQDLTLTLLQANTQSPRLAYSIARCDWQNWWQRYKTRSHYRANEINPVLKTTRLVEDTVDFEAKAIGNVDGEALWHKLPRQIKAIVSKRLTGQPLNPCERKRLSRFAQQNRGLLLNQA